MMILCLVTLGLCAFNHYDGGDNWYTITPTNERIGECFPTGISELHITNVSLRLDGDSAFNFKLQITYMTDGHPGGEIWINNNAWNPGTGEWYPYLTDVTLPPAANGDFAIVLWYSNQEFLVAHDTEPESPCFSWFHLNTGDWSEYDGDFAIMVNSGVPVEPTSIGNIKATYH
jgi:hypothetical protein